MKGSTVDDLARFVSSKLDVVVKVSREGNGGGFRYYLFVDGCRPVSFGPMSVHEAKGRLLMLSEMLHRGVISKAENGK